MRDLLLVQSFDDGGLANRIIPVANLVATSAALGPRLRFIAPMLHQHFHYFEQLEGVPIWCDGALHTLPSFAPFQLFWDEVLRPHANDTHIGPLPALKELSPELLQRRWPFEGAKGLGVYIAALTMRTIRDAAAQGTLPPRCAAFLKEHSDFSIPQIVAACDEYLIDVALLHDWTFKNHDAVTQHSDVVREWFRPTPRYEAAVENLLTRARREYDTLIGIHHRGNDFRTWGDGRSYVPLSDLVRAALGTASLLHPKRVCFLLCSDETIDTQALPRDGVVCGSGQEFEDLLALSRCDYIIGPRDSSFSYVAAFLGKVPRFGMMSGERVESITQFHTPTTL